MRVASFINLPPAHQFYMCMAYYIEYDHLTTSKLAMRLIKSDKKVPFLDIDNPQEWQASKKKANYYPNINSRLGRWGQWHIIIW